MKQETVNTRDPFSPLPRSFVFFFFFSACPEASDTGRFGPLTGAAVRNETYAVCNPKVKVTCAAPTQQRTGDLILHKMDMVEPPPNEVAAGVPCDGVRHVKLSLSPVYHRSGGVAGSAVSSIVHVTNHPDPFSACASLARVLPSGRFCVRAAVFGGVICVYPAAGA